VVTVSPENPEELRRDCRYQYKPPEKATYDIDHDEDQGLNGKGDKHDKHVTLVPPIEAILRVLQEPVEEIQEKVSE